VICKPCATAGDETVELRTRPASLNPPTSQMHANQRNGKIRRIRNGHRKCRGGTWCDCQHRIVGVAGVPEGRPA